jgi:hypothetical protein
MVLAPPSRKGTAYRWISEAEIAEAPAWLLRLVQATGTGGAESTDIPAWIDEADAGRGAEPEELPSLAELEAAVAAIPNENLGWTEWCSIGMAIYASCGGAWAGLDLFDAWSRKWPGYNEQHTFQKWQEIRGCPPTRTGFGKLEALAWEADPDWRAKIKGEAQPALPPEPSPVPKPDAWPELHPDALHGTAGKIVRAIEPHTESDPAALLIQTIVYFGNATARGPYYLVEDDKHYTNLFATLVGESSYSRKGTSAGRIRTLFMRGALDWAVNCIGGGLASGEGMIHRIRDRHETVDKKGKPLIDEGVPDKRLLIDAGEFYGALAVMKREGNTLSDIIRNAWDGRPLQNMTKNSPERCREPHVSAVAHITEDELRQHLDHTSLVNGFANRFLFALVKRSKLLAHGGATLDDETKDILGTELRMALESARKIGRVVMAPAAADMWVPVYEQMAKRPEGLYADACKRGDAQTMRLSMLYALLDGSAVIEPVHLRAGLALWDYCEQSTKRIFGDLLGEPTADEILIGLRRVGAAGLSRTDISALFKRHKSSLAIAQALQRLLANGKVRFTPRQARSAETWFAT